MSSMSSFSANRQGRSRPSNMFFGRRGSQEKSMPSPSFNSSMSLGHVEDVFCDSSRSVDRLRHHYLARPSTPSSVSSRSSPGARMERLPSLSDLFDRDILSPPSSGLDVFGSNRTDQGGESMRRTGSASSASSGWDRRWNTSFGIEGRLGSLGPPATPLSPYFNPLDQKTAVSPTTTSPDLRSFKLLGRGDGERTPRAVPRPRSDFDSRSNDNSWSLRCPGAPLIGVESKGYFETQKWQCESTPLGHFHRSALSSRYAAETASELTKDDIKNDWAAMSKLEAGLPKGPGLIGLGILLDEGSRRCSTRRTGKVDKSSVTSREFSPSGRQNELGMHTGLTPMVGTSKVSDVTTTPTRPKMKKSPKPLKTSPAQDVCSGLAKASPCSTAAKKRTEHAKTPLTKSRPMFRLDTGSGKRSSRPKGHKMSPTSSPWGVFGMKEGWKPVAAPNVSRAMAEANKLVAESANAMSQRGAALRTSPAGKRQANGSGAVASPTKRLRPAEAHESSSPYKENVDASFQSVSPSKRVQMLSNSYRNSPTALPLSTVR